jgi:hypothetical protein
MMKFCMECKEGISGRTDKKFCSDSCRNNFNNKRNADVTNYIRNVNSILRRNRRILEELASATRGTASRNRLLQEGFDLSYFTHREDTGEGEAYFCYEYGYIPAQNDQYRLFKADDGL